MADEREPAQGAEDDAYEPPAVETIGSADELAKGNEGSSQDNVQPQ